MTRVDSPAELQALMQADYPLSDQQWAAVTAPLEPAVVIAGAGSGKTTVMAARVVWLVATGQVAPHEVLGLTFTNKAAEEFATRVRQTLGKAGLLPDPSASRDPADPEVVEPTVATYHSYASTLLDEHGLRIGSEPDLRLLADASRYQIAARVVARYDAEVTLLTDHPPTVIEQMLSLDQQLSEHLCSPQQLRTHDAAQREAWAAEYALSGKAPVRDALNVLDRRGELLGLVEAYRAEKARLGIIEFGEQIERAARLASEHPAVGEAERARYKVVLLDEYQDTSVAQAQMLSRLFGAGHPVMAVGDPNQAIYGWRGASVSNILNFGDDFPRADSGAPARYELNVSRRSDVRILEVATALAGPLYAATPAATVLHAPTSTPAGVVEVEVHPDYDAEIEALPALVRRARDTVASQWRQIGILTRDNQTAADVYRRLIEAEIPAEVVGVSGLLSLPEVAEVVATLSLLHDFTDNASVLTVLNGPRWAIGPRDLALLGRRAAELAGGRGRADDDGFAAALAHAVADVDPADLASLCDALQDPGDPDRYGYSAEARIRFDLLSSELRGLRRHVSEPLLDLVRRVIDATGVDVELASSLSPTSAARRDNLDLFVQAVADFRPVEGEASLPALLAWLETEDEYGKGMEAATPSESDSVKVLTVHKAKGLEYDAVFVVGVADKTFPKDAARPTSITSPAVLPNALRGDARDLAVLRGATAEDIAEFKAASKQIDQLEELRLAYVAVTRARHYLRVSSYLWRRGLKNPKGPSAYQRTVREAIEGWGGSVGCWLEPVKGEPNPLDVDDLSQPWPIDHGTPEATRRRRVAAAVRAEMASPSEDEELGSAEQAKVRAWDDEIERLLDEAREGGAVETQVALPGSLSATALSKLRDDPDGFAAELARPMPRRPSRAARFGTRFHAWVESYFESPRQEILLDPDDLPGRADVGIVGDDELAELMERFRAGQFRDRRPVDTEVGFTLVLAGQPVRGRIDAVFGEDGEHADWLLVDWKTNRGHTADPLQLAIYRLAWAELMGVPVGRVRAGFYYVRDDRLELADDVLGRADLERLVVAPGPQATPTA